MLLSQPPPKDLQNALSIIMLFHISLSLIMKISSQEIKYSNKPMFMEFPRHTMFLIILKQLAFQNSEIAF